jgi:predicted transcriptional regulator
VFLFRSVDFRALARNIFWYYPCNLKANTISGKTDDGEASISNSIEAVLEYLKAGPVEGENEKAVCTKIAEFLKIETLLAEKIMRTLAKIGLVRKSSFTDYFFDYKSTRCRVVMAIDQAKLEEWERKNGKQVPEAMTGRVEAQTMNAPRSRVRKPCGYQTQPISSVQTTNLQKIVLIDGTKWPEDVKLPPMGFHSGGGGRRPHSVPYGVRSPLRGSSYVGPGGPGAAAEGKKRKKKKKRKGKKV